MGLFDTVRALRPRRSAFDLSYEKKFSCDLGQLIPVMCDEVLPGDTWHIGIESVVRFLPMVAPVLHDIAQYVHYFFVPYRLLDANWEAFITGGVDGQDAHTMPTWIPTHADVVNGNGVTVKDNGVGSLWDYFGFPVTDAGIIPAGAYPLAFPRRAYNLVYNTYYRDETQIPEVSLDSVVVRQRAWLKDYFTSALPWQQRGVAPSLPISGSSAAVWSTSPLIRSTINDRSVYVVNGLTAVAANANGAGPTDLLRGDLSGMNANTVNLGGGHDFQCGGSASGFPDSEMDGGERARGRAVHRVASESFRCCASG